jgi:transposase InsO family protein
VEKLDIIRPEQVWVSDITYINGRQNIYLALVTDAYSKKIMGYDLSDSLAAEGSIRALKMANKKRMYKQELLIHHSDRGLQYCCDNYQKILKRRNIVPSMTETYNPYANAIAERVNGIIKQEFLLEDYKADLKTMRSLVDEAVTTYNNKRPHLSCSMNTPQQMHLQRNIKIKSYKKRESCKVNLATLLCLAIN